MNLREYMKKNSLTTSSFAEILDVSVAHLRMLISGGSAPGRKLALKIEKITNGEITKEEAIFNYKSNKAK